MVFLFCFIAIAKYVQSSDKITLAENETEKYFFEGVII